MALGKILHPTDLGFLGLWNGGERGGQSFLPLGEEGSWENLVGGHFVAGPVLDAGDATMTKHRPVFLEGQADREFFNDD